MVHDIRAEFDAILDEIDWMDPSTKAKAKAKAAGIEEHIGYPSELLDSQKLNDLYAGLELDSEHYLGNALNMTVFGTNYAFSKLRERVSTINGSIQALNLTSWLCRDITGLTTRAVNFSYTLTC